MTPPCVLCPVDLSDGSPRALRLAGALAGHLHGSLIVAVVNDPLLARGAALANGEGRLRRETEKLLDTFMAETLGTVPHVVAVSSRDITTGNPALEIRRLAQLRHADVIVKSAHGLTGVRTWLLGSTTERVLRETATPVLVTPPNALIPDTVEAARQNISCVLAPVDLSDATPQPLRVARAAAAAGRAHIGRPAGQSAARRPPGHVRRRERRCRCRDCAPSQVMPRRCCGHGTPRIDRGEARGWGQ